MRKISPTADRTVSKSGQLFSRVQFGLHGEDLGFQRLQFSARLAVSGLGEAAFQPLRRALKVRQQPVSGAPGR